MDDEYELMETLLMGANLKDAIMIGANFENVDMTLVSLHGSKIDNRTKLEPKWKLIWELLNRPEDERNLYYEDLSLADLSDVQLPGANLQRADLSMSVFTNANLVGANLEKANLTRTDLSGADLTGADLRYTLLRDTNFAGGILRGRI